MSEFYDQFAQKLWGKCSILQEVLIHYVIIIANFNFIHSLAFKIDDFIFVPSSLSLSLFSGTFQLHDDSERRAIMKKNPIYRTIKFNLEARKHNSQRRYFSKCQDFISRLHKCIYKDDSRVIDLQLQQNID